MLAEPWAWEGFQSQHPLPLEGLGVCLSVCQCGLQGGVREEVMENTSEKPPVKQLGSLRLLQGSEEAAFVNAFSSRVGMEKSPLLKPCC